MNSMYLFLHLWGWDGWMASLAQWTWVWVNSGSWWWTGRPGVLRFMGSQRVGHDLVTDLNLIWYLWGQLLEADDKLGHSINFMTIKAKTMKINTFQSTIFYLDCWVWVQDSKMDGNLDYTSGVFSISRNLISNPQLINLPNSQF